MNHTHIEIKQEFRELLHAMQRAATGIDPEIERVMRDAISFPLDPRRAERLLTRVIEHLQEAAKKKGKTQGALFGAVNELVKQVMAARERVQSAIHADAAAGPMTKKQTVFL